MVQKHSRVHFQHLDSLDLDKTTQQCNLEVSEVVEKVSSDTFTQDITPRPGGPSFSL